VPTNQLVRDRWARDGTADSMQLQLSERVGCHCPSRVEDTGKEPLGRECERSLHWHPMPPHDRFRLGNLDN